MVCIKCGLSRSGGHRCTRFGGRRCTRCPGSPVHEIAPTGIYCVTGVAFRGTLWNFLRHAWLSLYVTSRGRRGALKGCGARDSSYRGISWHSMGLLVARGRRGSLYVVHEIASTGLFCVTGVAFRVTMGLLAACVAIIVWHFAWKAWLFGCGARDSTYRHILRDRRGVSWHSMELLAACVAIIVWHFAWQVWHFEGIICTR